MQKIILAALAACVAASVATMARAADGCAVPPNQANSRQRTETCNRFLDGFSHLPDGIADSAAQRRLETWIKEVARVASYDGPNDVFRCDYTSKTCVIGYELFRKAYTRQLFAVLAEDRTTLLGHIDCQTLREHYGCVRIESGALVGENVFDIRRLYGVPEP